MPSGRKRAQIVGRMNIETWVPDIDKLRERLAPIFEPKPIREKSKESK
jgi:hypothetical protein